MHYTDTVANERSFWPRRV